MFETFEKMILTGMGAAALTQKKGEELLQEMKERFNVTEEEGKAFLNRMQSTMQENQHKLEEAAQEEVRKTAERMGLVKREELEKLEKKVLQLEKQLKELQKTAS